MQPGSVPPGPVEAPTRKRLEFLDAIRGYVLCLVVVSHMAGGLANSRIPTPNSLLWVISYSYSFFMALMFLVSGIFVEQSFKKGSKDYFQDKGRTLLYPFVLWTGFFGAVQLFGSKFINNPGSKNPVLWFTTEPLGPLWFIQNLIIFATVYGLLRVAGLAPKWICAIGIVGLVASLGMPAGYVSRLLYMFGFFTMGEPLRHFLTKVLPTYPRSRLLIGGAIAFLLHAWWLEFISVHYARSKEMVPAAIFGIVASILLFAGIEGSAVGSFFAKIGRAALAIFVMHTFIVAATRVALMKVAHVHNPYIHSVIESVLGIGLPVLVWYAAENKFPWLFLIPKRSAGKVAA